MSNKIFKRTRVNPLLIDSEVQVWVEIQMDKQTEKSDNFFEFKDSLLIKGKFLNYLGFLTTRPVSSKKKRNISRSVVSDSFATPMDCSPPGSCVHGVSQARILGWVAISFSRASF